MRALIISCVFPPEPITSATTSAQLAEGLVQAGHKVTVVTAFPNRPGGRLYPGFRRGWCKREQSADGYAVVRRFATLSPSAGTCGRLLENISFGAASSWHALLSRADVVYANTWPLFAGGLLGLAQCLRRWPLLLSVQDIYPESAIELGRLRRDSPQARLLCWLDRQAARRATAIVTISRNFADYYASTRGIPRERVHVVHNWMDERKLTPGEKTNAFRDRLGLSPDTLLAVYAGNVGTVAGVEFVVRAAACLRERRVFILVAGDGNQRAACEALAQSLGLKNIRFHHPMKDEELRDIHASADVMLLPTRKSGALTSVPSKMTAYMLFGRAILAAVADNSDSARFIREADCGVIVPPEDPEALAQALAACAARKYDLARMGECARRYALCHFSREACLPRLVSLVEGAARA